MKKTDQTQPLKKTKVGTLFYQPKWSWDEHIEKELRKLCIGRTLNFPSGISQIGDVRADIDESVKPDIIADIMKPFKHFKKFEFDTVLCDPPFKFYNKIGWAHELSKLAKKRIIFCSPNVAIHLKKAIWEKEYFICEKKACYIFIKIFQIFTRKNKMLK